MTVNSDRMKIKSITGKDCPKGYEYAKEEFVNPVRILSTTVRVINGEFPLISVRTEKAIPKRLLLKAMEEIAQIKIEAPIQIGETIVENLLGTGIKLIATRNIKKLPFKSCFSGK